MRTQAFPLEPDAALIETMTSAEEAMPAPIPKWQRRSQIDSADLIDDTADLKLTAPVSSMTAPISN
jgi:hypothetical protein